MASTNNNNIEESVSMTNNGGNYSSSLLQSSLTEHDIFDVRHVPVKHNGSKRSYMDMSRGIMWKDSKLCDNSKAYFTNDFDTKTFGIRRLVAGAFLQDKGCDTLLIAHLSGLSAA